MVFSQNLLFARHLPQYIALTLWDIPAAAWGFYVAEGLDASYFFVS